MSLASLVKTGATREPLRILLHGVEGVGKTTFASKAPGVLFIGPEDGGGDLDIPRIVISTWAGFLDAVKALTNEPHDYRVLCIDTVDFLERLCHQMLTKGQTSMEKVEGGYGKGYKVAAEEQTKAIQALDVLRTRRRMHVIGLAHTDVRKFDDPQDAAYDRYQIRMHKEAAGLWSAWADCVLFANFDVKVKSSGDDILKKGKAVDKAPERVLYTERRPAFDAKNRFGLPFEMHLSWAEFAKEIRWDKRDAEIRSVTPPEPEPPSAQTVRAAAVDAFRNLDWLPEHVKEVCARFGVDKPEDIPAKHRAEALVIFAGPPPKLTNTHPEAK